MLTADVNAYADGASSEPDAALIFCDLFGERVAERVCRQIKNELNAWRRCDLSCGGCYRRWLQ
jgi:hypothetical protein